MFVVSVIPLKRGIQTDALTYFSSVAYQPGSLIKIPIRTMLVLGLVTNVESVSTAKTALRAATFSLRKLPPQDEPQMLSPGLIKTAMELADYYASSQGTILYHLLPSEIRDGELPLPHTLHLTTPEAFVPEVLEANRNERYLTYRSLVRESFAHSGSVLIVAPSAIEAENVYETLTQGIEDRSILITGNLTKKKLREAFVELEDYRKPQLIIATTSYAIVERHDITMVIVEGARSPFYKEHNRPYLDFRDVIRVHAKHTGRRLIFADILVRSEEEFERRQERYQTLGETPKRIELGAPLTVIPMKPSGGGETPFALFSPTVIELIREVKKKKARLFIYAPRRGLAPVVACLDCGFIFRSPESGAPYSLVRLKKPEGEERWFVCSSSGHRERAADVCSACGSWRLRERGIGIQYVYDELMKIVHDTPVSIFDHTTASTYKKACFLRDSFFGRKGSILLGTQMALPYLTRGVDTSIIVNMDALYATPTWRLEEDNLATLLQLREITKLKLIAQTRTEETSLLTHAKHATVEHFHTDELELRKTFNYPPLTVFIHLTWQGGPGGELIKEQIDRLLKSHNPAYYSSPPTPKGIPIHYALIRVARQDWPLPPLVAALRALSPAVRIMLNPDRIV